MDDNLEDDGQYQLDANDQRRLRPWEKILGVWPERPPGNHLQVFVSLRGPSSGEVGSPTIVHAGSECLMRFLALFQDI